MAATTSLHYLVPCLLLAGLCASCNNDNQSINQKSADGSDARAQQAPDGSLTALRFEGICDGSAAVRINSDQLLVAYDEQNALFLFDSTGGKYTRKFSYRRLLSLSQDDETDLEGAAISGGNIWWIGSHGLDGDGDYAPNRQVLFQTDLTSVSSDQLIITRGPIDLLPLLLDYGPLSSILTDPVMRKLPKSGGFNIEGLAADGDGNLMVALRSPLSRGNALIIKIMVTPDALVPTRLYRLDLGARGIRDILSVDAGFVLIAGSMGSGGRFTLFHWSPETGAREVANLPPDINAEALVDMNDHWLVLSDDGKVTRPDNDARDGDRGCDRIYKKNPLHGGHQSVFFRAVKIPRK